jgi:hypothetical protein
MTVRTLGPFSIDSKKTILGSPELPAFSHSQGQQGKSSRRRLGRCSHVFGLLARHKGPLAIMPFAAVHSIKNARRGMS